ncbi:LytTR family transcriptional regulator DNA-binding domain-containing protein [Tenacibaculum maritimum]|nr:LytTR family transcriptional regulator DNA-binding domain-containing protein [Tenacibaculum maritimum]MDB0612049.1 LytTR family transcriptional regulator DNA-binding domain-containing protein [Tenacibaculum maritimum]
MSILLKKDTVYFLSFISISFIVFIVSYFSINRLISVSTKEFLKIQIESSKREAEEMAKLVQSQITSGIPKKQVIQNLQSSIEDVNVDLGFICMFDWSGKEICHPDPNMIGKSLVATDQSFISSVDDDVNSEDLYNFLKTRKETGGIVSFADKERPCEVIYLYPVSNTDWIIAAHANLKEIKNNLKDLKISFILVHALGGIIIVLFSFFITRFIGGNYERQLEKNNKKLTGEILNMSKLNSDLASHKQKVEVQEKKNRILTYIKNELKPIEVGNIAYIYTELKITYIVDFKGKKSISNSSLEELFKQLDKQTFFRANRQYLLSIKAIDKIIKYGNSQLKIETIPKSDESIIISKNKTAEFKDWLHQ